MPGVEVGVEVEDGDGLGVDLGEGAEGGESEGMVASEGYEFGLGPWWQLVVGGLRLSFRLRFRVDGGVAGTEFEVGFAHLTESKGIVEGCDGDVAAVEDSEGGCVGVEVRAMVEAPEGGLTGGGGADGARTETRSCVCRISEYESSSPIHWTKRKSSRPIPPIGR